MTYTIRAFEADDWQALKIMRLEALRTDPGVFGSNFDRENAFDESTWRERATNGKNCMFGLYHHETLIGITGVVTDMDEPSGRTAVLIASYIQSAHRGRGIAKLLYETRLRWVLAQNRFDWVVTGHREGNDPSRRANQQWGFQLWKTQSKTWPDGVNAEECIYRMPVSEVYSRLNQQNQLTIP